MRDTLSLKNTKLGLETLERIEYDRRRVKILLNRANTNVGIEREDVLAILGRDVDILVPSHRDITRSVNQGQPIAGQRSTEAAKAFRALADLYVEESRKRASGETTADVIELPGVADAGADRPGRQSLFRRVRRSALCSCTSASPMAPSRSVGIYSRSRSPSSRRRSTSSSSRILAGSCSTRPSTRRRCARVSKPSCTSGCPRRPESPAKIAIASRSS